MKNLPPPVFLAALTHLIASILPLRPALANNQFFESLEWASADAQCIVRAKIVHIDEEPVSPNNVVWCKLELNVIETIKGPPLDRLSVAEWHMDSELHPSASDHELLIFLDRRDRYGEGPNMPGNCNWVVRRHGGWYQTPSSSQIVQIAGDSMKKASWGEPNKIRGKEMLDRINATVKWAADAGPVRPSIVNIAFDEGWGAYQLVVPLGEPFFQHARDFLSHNPDPFSRSAALNYLAQSNTPENQTAIRTLFVDPDVTVTLPSPTFLWNAYKFPIREAAYDALRKWNAPIDRPIINDPADLHEPAARTLIGIAVLLFAWPVAWLFSKRKNPKRFTFAAMVGTWCVILMLATGFAWALSVSHGVSIVWEHGGRLWQLASHSGLIRASSCLDNRPEVPRPRGVVAGIFTPTVSTTYAWDLSPGTLPKTVDTRFGISIGTLPPQQLTFATPERQIAIIPWSRLLMLLSLPTLLFAVPSLRRWDLRRTRRRRGHCTTCGYDLRATPTRCPECGTSA